MDELRSLLDRFWIIKSQDKQLYFDVKRALPQYRRFVNELLGWNLIVNESVIKLEKVPPRSMPWMGIESFTDTMDYCLLCALLLYLEDLDDGEQFLLSSLTEAIETYMTEFCPVDWTKYVHRKSLVRVLLYVQSMGLLVVYDGNSEGFGNKQDQEVLYENTGLSRHFPVHFGRDISDCLTVEDFEAFSWGEDGERGRQRINRVYRQLALAPALYWSEGDRADYEYVKNQRQWLEKNLDNALGGELQIHKNGVFFVFNEDSPFGVCHPRDLALSDVALLLCSLIRERVTRGEIDRREDDMIVLTHREFRHLVNTCKENSGSGWGKQLRELSPDKLYQELLTYMESWMLAEDHGDYLLICPAAGKWTGNFIKGFSGNRKGAQEDGSMENA